MKTKKITLEQESMVLKLYGKHTYQKIADIVGVTKNQVVEVFRRNNMFKQNYDYSDFIGKRFDKLVIIKRDETNKKKWLCKCDCGNIVSREIWNLRKNKFNSCGCNTKNTNRIGEIGTDKYGTQAKIIKYKNCHHITIEYQDKYKHRQDITYQSFLKHSFANPYHPIVYERGIIGCKYPMTINGNNTKEYNTWSNMLERCYSKEFKKDKPTYEDACCCDEWLYYPNFYEWLHSQENFDKWISLRFSSLDKDILVKGNKLYSPNTCCLVPHYVNTLFVKKDANRGEFPIGVYYDKKNKLFRSHVSKLNDENISKQEDLGSYHTPTEAFLAYKKEKEAYIKKIAQEEYDEGNITKQCYNAMMKYEVEITD